MRRTKIYLFKSNLDRIWDVHVCITSPQAPTNYCASRLNVSPVFAVYSLMVTSIEKDISEMNLDIDRVLGLIFSLTYGLLYMLGLDGLSACFCLPTLN